MGSVRVASVLRVTNAQAILGRLVVDRTGLVGLFDIALDYVPQSLTAQPENVPSAPNGPSLVTALREQLGLTFEKRKEPVEVLVIDQATMPTPN
jgi:uncharacterized protein (TIGR03435 family)